MSNQKVIAHFVLYNNIRTIKKEGGGGFMKNFAIVKQKTLLKKPTQSKTKVGLGYKNKIIKAKTKSF